MTCNGALKRRFRQGVACVCIFSQLSGAPFAYATPPAPTALPQGGNVASGSASIATTGANMTVNQGSNQAIINWNSFDVGSQASVQFNQPNAAASTLNRINSGSPSQIFGHLSANGQVFLINPSGVVFGPGSRVDVGALVASAKNLADQDYLNRNYKFTGGTGDVTNQGTINAAPGGYVALVGANVTNSGTINAPSGKAILTAGDAVQIPLDDSGLVTVDVTPGNVNAAVKNDANGIITTDNGQVYMQAEAADGLAAQVLNQGSVSAKVVTAKSVHGGSVFLDSGSSLSGQQINVTAASIAGAGTITAMGSSPSVTLTGAYISLAGAITANNSLGAGGNIVVSGDGSVMLSGKSLVSANGLSGGNVTIISTYGYVLASGAVQATGSAGAGGQIGISGVSSTALLGASIDASGASGGGTVLIGGGWHGSPALLSSASTTVDTVSAINADATNNGTGGTVAVWSGQRTSYYGDIKARGGLSGGNGGQVELSSAGKLNEQIANGHGVDVTARAAGYGNGWVTLDPVDVIIGSPVASFDIFKSLLMNDAVGLTQGGSLLWWGNYYNSQGQSATANGWVGGNVAIGNTYALIAATRTNNGNVYLYNLASGEWTDLNTVPGHIIGNYASGTGTGLAISDTYALIGSPGTATTTGAVVLYNITTGVWTNLTATSGAPTLSNGSLFGQSVALNATYALIGAPGSSSVASNAYLYNLSTGTWITPLLSMGGAPTVALGSGFGQSVALNGTYALIGTPGTSSTTGNAYLFNLNFSSGWTTLSSTPGAPSIAAGSLFGQSVALNATYALIGAPGSSSVASNAYLYKLSGGWTTLLSTSGAPTPALGSNFGVSVALNSTEALIGMSGTSGTTGNAYLYNIGTPGWTTFLSTTGAPVPLNGGGFGTAVALSDAYALVGAPTAGAYGDAYLYNLTTGAWLDMGAGPQPIGLNYYLSPYNGSAGYFGGSVALSSTYALIGATGTGLSRGDAYLYNLTTGVWTDLSNTTGQPIIGLANNSRFGSSVALNSSYALIGAGNAASGRGDAYLFNLSNISSGNGWTDLASTTGQPITGLSTSASFGSSVALNSTYALIGAVYANSHGDAYLFNLSNISSGNGWTDLGTTTGFSGLGLSGSPYFGNSVALNGSYALIGAYLVATNRGDAYLFNLSNISSGNGWTDLASTTGFSGLGLTAGTAAAFGIGVALNSTYALIGARWASSSRGDAYLYNLTTGTWTDLANTTGFSGLGVPSSAFFGNSVALNSAYALIGASNAANGRGDAYLFNLSNISSGNGWTDLAATTGQPITGLNNSYFGSSVALNSSYALIGAQQAAHYRGDAYLFNLSNISSGNGWTDLYGASGDQTPSLNGTANAYFGNSVALSGTYALIGANGVANSRGDAYLYNLTTGVWTDLALTTGNPVTALAGGSSFGTSVALNSSYALIGANGAASNRGDAYLFNLSNISSGNGWTDLASTTGQPITGLSGSALFGASVALNGTYALIGANGVTSQRGDAYLYNLTSGTWTDLANVTGFSGLGLTSSANFGNSVVLNNSYALIGAFFQNSGYGDAYLFNLSNISSGNGWTDLRNTGGSFAAYTSGQAGKSIALNNNYALIGVPGALGHGDAFLYNLTTGNWTDLAATTGQPITGLGNGSFFGGSVALNNSYALIGAPYQTVGSYSNAGDAYLFNLSNISSGNGWTDLSSTSSVPGSTFYLAQSNYHIGWSVSLNNNYALVGASGVPEGDATSITNVGNAYLINLSAIGNSSIVSPASIQAGLAAGNYKVVGDNSLSINSLTLTTANSGNSLTLESGGSINVNTSIVLGGRTATLLANGPNADLGSGSNRSAGADGITISGGSIDDTGGALTLQIGTAASTGRSGNYALAGSFALGGPVTAASILINGAESAINVSAALTASGTGTAVTLVGLSESFSGSGTISAASGNWLIYNTQTGSLGSVTLGSLTGFNRYGCTYGGSCTTGAVIPTSSNGVVYAFAPTLTLTGAITKVYDALATTSSAANPSGLTVAGIANSDPVIVQGTYTAGANVGTGLAVTYATTVAYGYILSGAPSGAITAKTITLSGVTAAGKAYDATTTATLSGTGTVGSETAGTGTAIDGLLYSGDGVTLATATPAGTFASKNVGTWTVTLTGYSLSGAKASNYSLNLAALSAAISKATLTVTPKAVSNAYTGLTQVSSSTTYSDTLSNYNVTGLKGTDTASGISLALSGAMVFTLNGTAVTTAKNAGTYVLTQGTLAGTETSGNYTVSYSNTTPNNYVITPVALTVTPNGGLKTYDGTTLNNTTYSDALSNYATITGFVNGETATGVSLALTGVMNFNGSTTTAVKNSATYALTQGTLALTSTNNNYTINFVNATPNNYVINPIVLTVTPNGGSKAYDGTTLNNTSYSDTLTNYTVTGSYASGETASNVGLALTGSMTFSGATTTVVKNAGTYMLGAGTLALTTNNGNYSLAFSNPANHNYQITAAAVTLTLTPKQTSVVYDGSTLNNATYSDVNGNYLLTGNFASGDTASNVGLTISGSMAFNGSTSTVVKNAGTYALSVGTLAATASNYTVTFANTAPNTYIITPKSLTPVYTASNKIYDATANEPSVTPNLSSSGVIAADLSNVTMSDSSATFATKNVGTGIAVTISGINLGGTAAGNYALTTTTASATANITARPITISSNSGQTKVYGTSDPTTAATAYNVTTGALQGTDSLAGSMGRAVGENVGSYNFTQGTVAVGDGNSGNNYAITFNGSINPFTITKYSALTATIPGQTKIYGANDPSVSGIAVTLANQVNTTVTDINGNNTAMNDTAASNLGASLTALVRGAGENVGSYNISSGTFTLSGTNAGNYNAPALTGSPALTITPASASTLSIKVVASKVYGVDDPGVGSNAGATPAITVSGAYSGKSVSTWNGNVTINDSLTATIAPSSLARAAGESVGTYAITLANSNGIAFGGTGVGDYAAPTSLISGSLLTITQASAGVSVRPTSKVYGQDDPALSSIPITGPTGLINRTVATWNGAVAVNDTSDTATVTSITRAAGEGAGTYAYMTATVKINGGNYTGAVDLTHGGLTISQDTLTLSLPNQTKVYGSADPAAASITPTFTPVNRTISTWNGNVLVNDSGSSALGVALTSLTRAAGESVARSPYAYTGVTATLSGTSAANYGYASAPATATLTITPALLHITPNGASVAYTSTTLDNTKYSDALANYTVTVSDLKNGDTVAGINLALTGTMAFGGSTTAVVKNAGTYALTVGTLAGTTSGNYTVVFGNTPNNAYVITKVSLTPVYTASNQVYNGTTTENIVTPKYALSGVIGSDNVTLTNTAATFDSKNVGSRTVTIIGIALNGVDAGNYTLSTTSATANATITVKSLTPIYTASNKVYDATTAAAVAANYTLSGVIGSDAVTFGDTSATFANANVGTSKTVTVSGISITGGADAGNYVLGATSAAPSANITARPITVSSNSGQTKVYGTNDPTGTATAYTVTAGALQGTDSLTGNMGRAVGEIASSYGFTQGTVTASDGNSGNNYAITFNGSANPFTITPSQALVATVANQTKVYGANDPSLSGVTATLNGMISGTVTDINGNNTAINDSGKVAVTVASLSRVAGEGVGSYAITNAAFNALTGTAAGNYAAPILASGSTLTVTPANSLSVTVTASKVYASDDPGTGTNKGVLPTITVAGVISNPSVSTWNGTVAISDNLTATIPVSSLTRLAGETAGTYAISLAGGGTITMAGTGAGNYTVPTSLSGTSLLTITAAPSGMVIGATSKLYGQDDSSIGSIPVTYNGQANRLATTWNGNVQISDLSQPLYVTSIGRTTGEGVGTYAYATPTVSYNGSTYGGSIDSTTNKLTIDPALLTVSINNQAKTFGASDPSASSVGFTPNGVVNRSVTDWNGNVTPINDTTAANLAIAISGLTRQAGEARGTYNYLTATFALTGTDASNYATPTLANTPTLTISNAILTLTPKPVTVTYNATTLGNTAYSDLLNSYNISGYANSSDTAASIGLALTGIMAFNGVTSTTVRDAATYTLGQGTLAGTTTTGNYAIVFSNAAGNTYTINPAFLVPVYTASSKTYDSTTAATVAANYAASGVYSGDSVIFANTSATFSNKNVGTGKTVTISGISISGGAQAADYILNGNTTATTTANITPANLTITGVTASSRTYNATTSDILNTASDGLSGVLSGDQVALSSANATGTFADKNIGNSKAVTASGFAISGADSGNYTFAQPTGLTANITPASLTVSGVTASSKTYDTTVNAPLNLGNAGLGGVFGSDNVVLGSTGATGSFADKNVGNNKGIIVSGFTISGTDANNYTLAQPTGLMANITPASLTVSGVTAANKTYDTTVYTTLNVDGAVLSGLRGSDNVVLSSLGQLGVFADKNVGNNKTVTINDFTISGTDTGNYIFAQPTNVTANITPVSLTITGVTASNKIYDATTADALNTAGSILSGVLTGDQVTLSSVAVLGTFADKNVGNGKMVTGSGFAISGADSADYNLIQPTGLTANIAPRTLTYSLTDGSGTTASSAVTGGVVTFANLVPGDTAPAYTLGYFDTSGTTQISNPFTAVGSYLMKILNLGTNNYQIAAAGNHDGLLLISAAQAAPTSNHGGTSPGSTLNPPPPPGGKGPGGGGNNNNGNGSDNGDADADGGDDGDSGNSPIVIGGGVGGGNNGNRNGSITIGGDLGGSGASGGSSSSDEMLLALPGNSGGSPESTGITGDIEIVILKLPVPVIEVGFSLLDEIQLKLPNVRAILSVTGLNGAAIPPGVEFDPATNTVRSSSAAGIVKLEAKVRDSKNKTKKLLIEIGKKVSTVEGR